jgi:RNA polymerase sigma factor (sigma-70 family)
MQPLADSDLIRRSRQNPEAFAAIFDRHFATVHRYVAHRATTADADDLAAETFVVAFGARRRFDDRTPSALPWLLGIATRLMLNDRRQDGRFRRAMDRLPHAPDGDPRPIDAGIGPPFGDAVRALRVDERNVLLLHVFAELTYEEIAIALGVPIGTVRSRLSRARAHIRAAVARDASTPLEAHNA